MPTLLHISSAPPLLPLECKLHLPQLGIVPFIQTLVLCLILSFPQGTCVGTNIPQCHIRHQCSEVPQKWLFPQQRKRTILGPGSMNKADTAWEGGRAEAQGPNITFPNPFQSQDLAHRLPSESNYSELTAKGNGMEGWNQVLLRENACLLERNKV